MIKRIITKVGFRNIAVMFILLSGAVLRLCDLGSEPLFRDEAYYNVWAEKPSVCYYDHPPAVALLIAVSRAIIGESEFAIRFLFAISGLDTILLVYLLGKRYFNVKVGLMASAMYAFEFGNVLFSRLAFNDAPLILIFTLFLLLYPKDCPKDGKFDLRTIFLLGITLGAGLVTKYTMVVVPIALIFYLIFSWSSKRSLKKDKKREFLSFLLVLVIAFICFLPVLSWNYTHEFASFTYQGGHAFSTDILTSIANGDYFFDIFYFPRRMALGFTPISILIISFASFLFAFDFHHKKSRAFLFAPALIFAFVASFAGAVPVYFEPDVIPLEWKIVVFLCYIPQILFLLLFLLSIERFRTDSHRFLVIFACAPMLLFSLSPARLPHWALPSLVPFSLLGAELLERMPDMLKTNLNIELKNKKEQEISQINDRIKNNKISLRKSIKNILKNIWTCIKNSAQNNIRTNPSLESKVAFIIFILILLQCAAYSVTSLAMRSKPISVSEMPFRSGYSSSWYTSEVSIKNMAKDFDAVYSTHEGSLILTPTWQTYSGLVYYSKYAKLNNTYTFAYDYQIGIVFEKDIANIPSNITNATIAIYRFSHQNFTIEEILNYLVYSPVNETNYGNRWTVYSRTNLDFFIIEKQRNGDYPYIIAYAEFRNLTYVQIQHDGVEYRAEKSEINYLGESGKAWIDVFT